MSGDIGLLSLTALSIGFIHTLLGPDHYLPFVAMARCGRWSLRKTLVITLLCGLGHVLGSVVLGLVGIAFGVAVLNLESIEAFRGDIAGWLLLVFGLLYFLWGLRRAVRGRPHTHTHRHDDGIAHSHEHAHEDGHLHVHLGEAGGEGPATAGSKRPSAAAEGASMRPWILFAIFLFGPCEPLIPLLMYPAAGGHFWNVVRVTAIFGAATLATMTTLVVVGYLGARSVQLGGLQRYEHAFAGLAILACGIAVTAGL